MESQWNNIDVNLWNNDLLSDKAVFNVCGFINSHICHFVADNKLGITI